MKEIGVHREGMSVLGLEDMMIEPDHGLREVEVMVGVIERTAMMMIDMRGVRSEETENVKMSTTLWYA